MIGKKVTIVIPTFNSEVFIADALKSIYGQKEIIPEVIIVDKESEDQTKSISGYYANKMNIRFISEKKSGVPVALNIGFEAASSKYLCWLNSDDVYVSPNALRLALNKIINNNLDYVIGHSVCLSESGIVKKTLYTWSPSPNSYRGDNNIFTGSLLFSRESWTAFGGFNEKYNIGFEYELLKYLIENKKYGITNTLIGGFRIRPDALSNKYADILINQQKEILKGNSKRLSLNKINRFISHMDNNNLLDVIRNRIKDKYSGLTWEEVWKLYE